MKKNELVSPLWRAHEKKLLRIMKLTTIIMFIGILNTHAGVYSQDARISVDIQNGSLIDLFNAIEQNTDYKIFYKSSLIKDSQKFSLVADKTPVSELLSKALTGKNLSYDLVDKVIVITPLEEKVQQQLKISGTVSDANTGETLPGVSILVEGTTTGTISGFDGKYSLEVPSGSGTLTFSFVGYLSQKIEIAGQAVIDVKLTPDIKKLDEIVVIGYGTQTKGDVTGSVASVKSEDFTSGSVTDAGQLIQGKVAGLSIISPSGDPTSSTQILLRGQTTLMGTSQNPLILIDGVPGDMKTVATQDIESIDVLKDGSAAAIYGTRGTNGVILITTKRAKNNKSTVEYSGYASTQTIARKLNLSTAADFRAQIAAGYRLANDDLGSSTDWLKQITQTPLIQSHNLTIRGGNETSNYLVNLNYSNAQGLFLKSYEEVFSGRADFNHSMFNNKVKINIDIFNSSSASNGFNGYIYRQSVIQNPTAPVKNPDGTWFQQITKFEYENPVSDLKESNGVTNDLNTRYKATVIYSPVKGLKLSSLFSYSKHNQDGGYAETKQHVSTLRDGRNGYASTGATQWIERMTELTAEYSRSVGKHNFTILGGYSYQEDNWRTHFMDNWDFPTDVFGYNSIQEGQALKNGLAHQTSDQTFTNLIGFFSRITYNYDDRYLLMASLRHEEASQLWGTKEPWGTFPAISAGWRITKESFMKDQHIFNDLKLRAGYGVTGSQPSTLFSGVALLGYGNYVYSNGTWLQTLVPTQNPNPGLKWEEKHETNLGIDFSMLSDRVGGSIDFYDRQINNLLFNYAVPSPPNLYNTTEANVGKMENKGLEVLLNFVPVKNSIVEWNTGITFSTNKNKLVSLSNDIYRASSDYLQIGYTGPPVQTFTHLLRVGGPVGDFYGFKVIDIDNNPNEKANYGKWIYEGADGKPVKDSAFSHSFGDKKVIGNGLPKYYLSWNNTFRFKNWDLSVTQRGAFKFQIANFQRMMYENPTYTQYNLLKSAFDKVYGKTLLKSPPEFNSYYIENGDYWKIDNITLGYTFKKTGLKYFQSLRFYVATLNTFIITHYKGIDPEVSLRNGQTTAQSGINVIPTTGLDPGIDQRDKFPTTRTFSIGLNATF